MKEIKKLLTNPYIYIFLLTYYAVWVCWDFIKLPLLGTEGIISYLPSINYNPSNNLVRYAFAIFLPPLACLGYWWITNSGKRFWVHKKLRLFLGVMIVLFSLLLCVGMGIVQASTNPKNNPAGHESQYAQLDTFHEGEALGPAVSYQDKDLKPYKNFVFVHGVFQDPGRAVLAFKIFGRSIGAVRALAAILTIVVFLLIYCLMLTLFRGNILKSALGLSLFGLVPMPTSTMPFLGKYIVGVQLPFRDITTILILITAILAFRFASSQKRLQTGIASGVIGFIACINFANSTDRAMYGVILSVFWLVLMAFVSKQKIFTKTILPSFVAGGIVGIPIVGAALKWDFVDFVYFLKTVSRYKEFLDGMPFTRPEIPVSLLMIVTAAGITIIGSWLLKAWLGTKSTKANLGTRVKNMRSPIAALINSHFIVILFFATSTVFLRSGVGRADIGHFTYSVQWLYILGIFLFVQWIYTKKHINQLVTCLSILLLIATFGFFAGSVKRINLAKDTFPINVKDEAFVRADHLETAKFLKENLQGDESFVTFTSEASWYYLVDKPSPVQYPIVWFAFMPQQRQSLARSIEDNENIKYIITNNNWTSNFDYIPVSQRLPEAYAILQNRYEPVQGFGQQTVWQRK